MKNFSPILLLIRPLLLVGCDEKMTDLKVAVSEIISKANEAEQALGEDVRVLWRTEINYSDVTITNNSLFITILRNVQWFYEPKQMDQTLKITGTWQPSLFHT